MIYKKIAKYDYSYTGMRHLSVDLASKFLKFPFAPFSDFQMTPLEFLAVSGSLRSGLGAIARWRGAASTSSGGFSRLYQSFWAPLSICARGLEDSFVAVGLSISFKPH